MPEAVVPVEQPEETQGAVVPKDLIEDPSSLISHAEQEEQYVVVSQLWQVQTWFHGLITCPGLMTKVADKGHG